MIANKLKPGDEIRVIAPSRNLTEVWHVAHHHAVDFWHKEGFNLTFSKNSCEIGKFHSSSLTIPTPFNEKLERCAFCIKIGLYFHKSRLVSTSRLFNVMNHLRDLCNNVLGVKNCFAI